eukprot:jgi/Picsp_1/5011/NSC_02374-R1_---NA---
MFLFPIATIELIHFRGVACWMITTRYPFQIKDSFLKDCGIMYSKVLTLALLLSAVGASAQISCGDIADLPAYCALDCGELPVDKIECSGKYGPMCYCLQENGEVINTNVDVPSSCNFEEVCSEECGGYNEIGAASGCSEDDESEAKCVCALDDGLPPPTEDELDYLDDKVEAYEDYVENKPEEVPAPPPQRVLPPTLSPSPAANVAEQSVVPSEDIPSSPPSSPPSSAVSDRLTSIFATGVSFVIAVVAFVV